MFQTDKTLEDFIQDKKEELAEAIRTDKQTLEETAASFGVTVNTVQKWIAATKEGKLDDYDGAKYTL